MLVLPVLTALTPTHLFDLLDSVAFSRMVINQIVMINLMAGCDIVYRRWCFPCVCVGGWRGGSQKKTMQSDWLVALTTLKNLVLGRLGIQTFVTPLLLRRQIRWMNVKWESCVWKLHLMLLFWCSKTRVSSRSWLLFWHASQNATVLIFKILVITLFSCCHRVF